MERINYLKEQLLAVKPEVDIENALILTESFIENEGEPLVVKKAKGFYKQCQEKTITIGERELIVGNPGSKLRGGILCPDTCWTMLESEMDTINERKFDPFYFSEKDKQLFVEKIRPYWCFLQEFFTESCK